MSNRTKDFFYKKAKEKGVVARSYYKIEDLDEKYRLVKKNYRVMDIGAAPGSWIQYVQDKIGDDGFVLAFDLNPLNISIRPNVTFIEGNIFDFSAEQLKRDYEPFDLMISDVAPRTTGNYTVDHTRSFELCSHVLEIASACLKQNSKMICKMYQGEQTRSFVDAMKKVFSEVKIQKPVSSRAESSEVFIVATGKK